MRAALGGLTSRLGVLGGVAGSLSQTMNRELHEISGRVKAGTSQRRGGAPISIGRLAQVTITKQPTVTRLLDRMEARGQVERLPHDRDRRITLVRISRKGAKTVAHLMALAREHELRVLEPFGLPRAEELKNTLRQMIELHARTPIED